MNFPFTIGKRINRGTHFEYQKITFPAASPLKIGRLREGYSLIENSQEAGASHWHDMLDTFQIILDATALSHLNTQLSTPPAGEPVFLFEVPENGRITVVEKEGRLLFLFQTFNYRFWEIPLGNSTDTSKRPLGNTLVFSREPFSQFEASIVHDIIKETLINWSVANKGSRLLFLGSNDRISRAQTNQINGDRRIANQIVNLLTNPGGGAFNNDIYMPSHNYYLPVKEGYLIPLFYMTDRNWLSDPSANPAKYKIGISDIPSIDEVITNEKWSWFHALEFLIRKEFEGIVLQQQDAFPASTFNDYTRTNSLKGWFPLSATLNASRISKIKYKNLEIFNPIQNELPSAITSFSSISTNSFFLNGSDTLEIYSLTNYSWSKQGLMDLSQGLSPTVPQPHPPIEPIDNNTNNISVGTPNVGEFLKVSKFNVPPPIPINSFNIVINYVQNYNSDNNATNDAEYYLDRFIQRVRDIRFHNSAQINEWFIRNYGSDYIDWYNTNMDTQYIDIANTKIRFNTAWDKVSLMFPSTSNANFIQFICLMMESSNEVGWSFSPRSEALDLSGTFKYNRRGNILASTLFQAHSLFRNTHEHNAAAGTNGEINNNLIIHSMPAQITADWSGHATYPAAAGYSPDPRISESGMISQADFYKFRGRGIIQNTWRGAYKRIISEILRIRNDPGVHPHISRIGNNWFAHAHSEEDIATISTNEEWDTLFQDTNFHIACYAVQSHALGWGHPYWDLPMDAHELLKSGSNRDRSIWSVGSHINGGNPVYAPGLVSKVMKVVQKLSI